MESNLQDLEEPRHGSRVQGPGSHLYSSGSVLRNVLDVEMPGHGEGQLQGGANHIFNFDSTDFPSRLAQLASEHIHMSPS